MLEQAVAAGDIFRMCQTKDLPIQDWVKLAVTRARATGDPAVFWLDEGRAHDAKLIAKVKTYLAEHDTDGLQIEIMSPVEATAFSLERIRRGEDTISVTGNVLRDYLTDLFPILELGTSAKMLSVVPLMNGGGLFETGAGGSAPEARPAARQGELPALGQPRRVPRARRQLRAPRARPRATRAPRSSPTPSTAPPAPSSTRTSRRAASWAASTTAAATSTWRCTGRRSWRSRPTTPQLAEAFAALAKTLTEQEQTIVDELIAVQGSPVDIGGYYQPDAAKASAVMRPSATFNEAIATLG